jgi:hypothetical protein
MQKLRGREQFEVQPNVTEAITVQLDRLSQAALDVLRSDGTNTTDAVRDAITDAAERIPEPPSHTRHPRTVDLLYAEQLELLATAAPPLTNYQRYVLAAAFTEEHSTWLSEAQWLATQSAPRASSPLDTPDPANRSTGTQDDNHP